LDLLRIHYVRGGANFFEAKFRENAVFSSATFAREALFVLASFEGTADFRGTRFQERATFFETVFRNDATAEAGPIFSLARFERPELVTFSGTYLGQALFHSCDVSKFAFSVVRWRDRENGKSMVFEELVDLQHTYAMLVAPPKDSLDKLNYRLIAELYQQLKKNYDDKRDYWTAGDFHYGEMEMKRLATPQPNFLTRWLKRRGIAGKRFDAFRRWWHQYVGLAALYKYASEYGESYGRPALWLALLLVVFTLVYPLVGLRPSAKSASEVPNASLAASPGEGVAELSYANFVRYGATCPHGTKLTYASLLGHSLMTTIGVAAFQRDLAYEPTYWGSRLLSWLELFLTSIFIALFLLAVRRQFRR
jgi:hypothetical protein